MSVNLGVLDGIAIYKQVNYEAHDLPTPYTVALTGDNNYRNVSIPFPFPFWGLGPFSNCYVCTNGFITFQNYYSSHVNSESRMKSRLMIAPFWDDLVTRGNHVRTDTFLGPDRFVIDWDTYRHGRSADRARFQVVLYRSGLIRFNYIDFSYRDHFTPTIGVGRGINTVTLDLVSTAVDTIGPSIPFYHKTQDIIQGSWPNWTRTTVRVDPPILDIRDEKSYEIYLIWSE